MCKPVPEVRSSLPKADMSAVILKDVNKRGPAGKCDSAWHRAVSVQDAASIGTSYSHMGKSTLKCNNETATKLSASWCIYLTEHGILCNH